LFLLRWDFLAGQGFFNLYLVVLFAAFGAIAGEGSCFLLFLEKHLIWYNKE